jgi:predicted O-linked N-acetylglucosamine transferase (SPINDLY family)
MESPLNSKLMSTQSSDSIQDLLRRAMEASGSGATASAIRHCNEILVRDPEQVDALHLMGVFSFQLGRYDEADHWCTKALAVAPHSHQAFSNRAAARSRLRQYGPALADAEAALARAPAYVDAMLNRAEALFGLTRYDETIEACQRVLRVNPAVADALACCAAAMRLTGRLAEAKANAEAALKIAPDHAFAWFTIGALLQQLGQEPQALLCYERTLKKEPNNTLALLNSARLNFALRNFSAAAKGFEKAKKISPTDFEQMAGAQDELLHAKMIECEWSDFPTQKVELCSRIASGKTSYVSFNALAVLDDPQLQMLSAQQAANNRDIAHLARKQNKKLKRLGKPLRVGFVSADFREHPAARLLQPLIANLDRARIDPIGIGLIDSDGSVEGQRIREAFTSFVSIHNMSDETALPLLEELELDIAVDLMGHTIFARQALFAQRIAPIQVNFLGFAGTLGAPWIDYIMADPIVAPPGADAHFTEKLCRLPHTYYPTNPNLPDLKPTARSQWNLPDNAVVFACFCNSWKITPEYFATWMDLLKSTPNSVLWMLSGSQPLEKNLRGEAKRQGVKPNRLIFAPRVSNANHLSRHSCVDVMLDTGPYGAHTTACDSLIMGVPLVVKTGATFAARVSTSILNAAGLAELAHDSFENYLACARNLAWMPEKRAALSKRVRAAIASTPLFDDTKYAVDMQRAFEAMAERAAAGLDPENIML